MLKAFCLVFISELWMVVGHICFKKSASDRSLIKGKESWIIEFAQTLFQRPLLLLGLLTMITGLLFWFAALAVGELSAVYLLGSVQYLIILFAARFFLNEKIDALKLIGTLLVSIGVILTTLS